MHRTFSVPRLIGWWSLLVALTLHVGTLAASAQSTIQPANYAPGQSDNPQRPVIRMVLGTSSTCTMTTRADLKRVENPNGKIVRVERIPDKTNEIRLVAEFPGRTFVTFTDQKDYVEIHEVVVVGEVQDAKKITMLKLEKGDQVTKTLEKAALGGLRITRSEVVEVKQAQNDPKSFTFIARGAGLTRVFFFSDKDQQNILAVFDVEVAPEDPIGQLRDIIKQIPTASVTVTKIKLPPLAGVPQQPGVPITTDGVILTGYVTNAELTLQGPPSRRARRLFPASPTGQMQQVSSGATTTTTTLTRDNVINQIRIAGVQQVQLHVVVAVVNRSRARQMSFSFAANGNEWFAVQPPIGGGPPPSSTRSALASRNTAGGAAGRRHRAPPSPTGHRQFPNVQPSAWAFHNNNNFLSFLQILTTEGVTKILAEPRVTTLSGRPANILSGGSTPILTSAGVGAPSVSYQQFGTVVNCLPVVQGNGKILLEVKADISSINAANGISIAGVTPTSVPGFDQRTAQVTVMLEDGQTIAIGGLIQNKVNATRSSKIPESSAIFRYPASIFFTSKTWRNDGRRGNGHSGDAAPGRSDRLHEVPEVPAGPRDAQSR